MSFDLDKVNEISVRELKEAMDTKQDFELIDVREPNEFEFTNLGGKLIPQGEVLARHNEIDCSKKVYVLCRSGKRSYNAILNLQKQFKMPNLYNITGGILQWSDEIDPEVPKY